MLRARVKSVLGVSRAVKGSYGWWVPGVVVVLGWLVGAGWLPTAPAHADPTLQTFTLYDGAAGGGTQTPNHPDQGFDYLTLPIPPTAATQSASGGVTMLNSSGANADHAGYFNRSAKTPVLNRTSGYTVTFTVQIEAEAHTSNDRAGFSIIVLSSDKKGIELGFWQNEIWAQHDDQTGDLFTHGEGMPVDTTVGLTAYDLAIVGNTYTLSTGGTTLLTGPVRDYSAFSGFPDVYEIPNFLFLGDNTTSAGARIKLARVAVLIPSTGTPTPTATGTAAASPTPTSTQMPSRTPTVTPTASPTPTLTATFLPLLTVTSSSTSTASATDTATATRTPTATATTTRAPTEASSVPNDFNGDGRSDILWRHQTSGRNALWALQGFTRTNGAIARVSDLTWQVVGSGNFNGDGRADVLWRNEATGDNTIWLMQGWTRTSGTIARANVNWRVAGVGDFDGDGQSDILWRHQDGRNTIWLMNGFTHAGGAIAAERDLAWQVVGIGDFDGDHRSDILWRHQTTGANTIWLMNRFAHTAGAITRVSMLAWQVVGTGDFNGDGRSDILWRRTDTGANALWTMNRFARTNGGLDQVADLDWKVVGTGDYNGDGRSDVLWRHAGDGRNMLWLMHSWTATPGAIAGVTDLDWKVVGTGGYDYDGSGVVGPAAMAEEHQQAGMNLGMVEELTGAGMPGEEPESSPLLGEPPGARMPEEPPQDDPTMVGEQHVFIPIVVR